MERKALICVASLLILMLGATAMAEGTAPGHRSTGVMTWGNGKAYFFKGGQYIRYDMAADRADPGYPKPIDGRTWPGMVW